MRVFDVLCQQRGCESVVEQESAPTLCPICNNPLHDGAVIEVIVQQPAPTPAPEPAPAPAPEPTPGV